MTLSLMLMKSKLARQFAFEREVSFSNISVSKKVIYTIENILSKSISKETDYKYEMMEPLPELILKQRESWKTKAKFTKIT